MNRVQNEAILSGYWAMNTEQRRERNRELLNVVRKDGIPVEIRKKHLEKLLLHTLHGKVITEQLLTEPEYAEYQEQLRGVMATLGEREIEVWYFTFASSCTATILCSINVTVNLWDNNIE